MNDCPHSSTCSNTKGWYACKCKPGYVDESSLYYLLPGRFCNVPTTTTQATTLPKTTTTVSTPPTDDFWDNIQTPAIVVKPSPM